MSRLQEKNDFISCAPVAGDEWLGGYHGCEEAQDNGSKRKKEADGDAGTK